MAKKKKKSGGGKRQGHYCKVCGEHKANEKFSGKGHASHICKSCSGLPVDKRSEMMTINKIDGMSFRYLSDSEIKWLRGKMNDQRPEVREAAKAAHSIKFPHYERNMAKKGLTAYSLEFFIHDDIWDEYGDEISVHMRFFVEHTGTIKRIACDDPEEQRETEVDIGQQAARKLLKAIVQQLNAPFWDEDYSDNEYEYDPYLDILPEYRPDSDDWDDDEDWDEPDDEATPTPDENREVLWSILLELNTGEDKEIIFYNNTPDEVSELFWLLMEYFETDEDFDDDEE